MKGVKRKLSKVALFYNVINILSLIISIICYQAVENSNLSGLVFIIPCIAILSSVLLTITPLLEKNADLSHINYKTYQKVNMSISIVFCVMQIALLSLMLSVGFNAHIMICIALGLLLMFVGNVLPKMKSGSFFGVFFPKVRNNYQAWRRFIRFTGFVFFIEGLAVIILGGLYKNWLTYIYILIMDIIVIIILYLAMLFFANKYKMENIKDEVED